MIPGGGGGASDTFENRKAIAAIKDEQLGMNEKPDYVSVKASVSYIKHDNDPWYTACPDCHKKVTSSMSGDEWRCEKCNISHPRVRNSF